MTLEPDKLMKPRKPHPCFFCGEIINAREECWYRHGVEGFAHWRMWMHDECREATIRWGEYDFLAFEEGTMKRGTDELR